MSAPTAGLSVALIASQSIPTGTSVYDGPTPQIVAPAIVIRPDEPWISSQDVPSFCIDVQRYAAICVVQAASPQDGMHKLYSLARGIIATVQDVQGWSFVLVTAPVIDESTGSAFLAATVRLQYLNTTEEEAS